MATAKQSQEAKVGPEAVSTRCHLFCKLCQLDRLCWCPTSQGRVCRQPEQRQRRHRTSWQRPSSGLPGWQLSSTRLWIAASTWSVSWQMPKQQATARAPMPMKPAAGCQTTQPACNRFVPVLPAQAHDLLSSGCSLKLAVLGWPSWWVRPLTQPCEPGVGRAAAAAQRHPGR